MSDSIESLEETRRALIAAFTTATSASGRRGPADCDHSPGTMARAERGPAVMSIRQIAAVEARDVLDSGSDVVLTRDPATLAYAGTRSDLLSLPLMWDRGYVLVVPDGDVADARGAPDSGIDGWRAELATDAVPVEARPFLPASWDTLSRCALPVVSRTTIPDRSATRARRIVYPREDTVARLLAERLVALAAAGSPSVSAVAPALITPEPVSRAAGLGPQEWARVLAGVDRVSGVAYVVRVRLSAAGCEAEVRGQSGGPSMSIDSAGRDDRITPLIETRPRAIIHRVLLGVDP